VSAESRHERASRRGMSVAAASESEAHTSKLSHTPPVHEGAGDRRYFTHCTRNVCGEVYDPNENLYGRCRTFAGF
jgi:hypothetical protein